MHFKEPVAIRPELQEKVPAHADMLRYDQAFHHPTDPSLVIFPLFRNPHGRMPDKITIARWSSFIIKLELAADYNDFRTPVKKTIAEGVDDIGVHNTREWITYVHPDGNTDLEPTTLHQYLDARRKTTIVGYREA